MPKLYWLNSAQFLNHIIYWPTEIGFPGMPTIELTEAEYAAIKAAFDSMDVQQTFIRENMILPPPYTIR